MWKKLINLIKSFGQKPAKPSLDATVDQSWSKTYSTALEVSDQKAGFVDTCYEARNEVATSRDIVDAAIAEALEAQTKREQEFPQEIEQITQRFQRSIDELLRMIEELKQQRDEAIAELQQEQQQERGEIAQSIANAREKVALMNQQIANYTMTIDSLSRN